MPKLAKPLTELEVRKAKLRTTAYMLSDGGGLYLSVSPAGLKSWVVRVRLPGTTTATPSTIGHYPGKVMQEWADYLDALRIGNDVVQLRKRA